MRKQPLILLLYFLSLPLGAQETGPDTFAALLGGLPPAQQPAAIPQPPLIQLHRELLTTVRQTPAGFLPIPEAAAVPKDYQYFLTRVLPAFARSETTEPTADPHLLGHFAKGTPYRAALIFTGFADTPRRYGAQLEVTGGYTSEFQYPVGFFAVHGMVVNPALQPWDGLVIAHPDGHLEIHPTDDPHLTPEPLNIKGSQQDYRRFLHLVESRKLSVFQSHLLVGLGQNLVQPRAGQPSVRRRVLFRDRQGGLGLYDSLDTPLTLYDVAKILLENYHALYAVNLDTGSYNYCVYLRDGIMQRDCGALKAKAHLSNILQFSFSR